MIFQKTNINRCKILDRYKIDIEKTNQLYLEKYAVKGSSFDREYCELVAESEDYRFYCYKTCSDHSGGFILRQNKSNPKKVVFFGKNKTFNIVFHGYLFQVNASDTSGFGTSDRMIVTARNIVDGKLIRFNWISDKYLWRNMYNGHAPSQDKVNNVRIMGNKLIFEMERKKSWEMTNDEFDIDAIYVLEVEYKNSKFCSKSVFFPFEKNEEGKFYSIEKINNDFMVL